MKTKILIIEDNEQNLYLLTFILKKHDYEVLQALNGLDGIEKVKKTSPDMILLDIQLPEMDGYEVARELRKIPESKIIPIIAITSYAMAGDREKALEAGCTGYLTKPINPDTFISSIEEFLPNPFSERDGLK
jgi:two-component system cell cycle response regulator DivK